MTDPADRTQTYRIAARLDRPCPDCGGPLIYNHDVYCPGPAQRVWRPVERVADCDCIGAWHEPDCEQVA